MARNYSRPKIFNRDGLDIYYTDSEINTRGRQVTRVKMSYRAPKKSLCEGQPEYGHILYEQAHEVPDELRDAPDPIHATIAKHARAFYCGLLRKLAQTSERGELLMNIPFGTACEVWFEDNPRSPSTLKKYDSAYQTICNDREMCRWLSIPCNKITPALCNQALGKQDTQSHKKIVSLIRAVLEQEVQSKRLTDISGELITENPWASVIVRRPGKERTSTENIYRYVLPKAYETSQVAEIISICLAQLATPGFSETKVICLLALFVCCMGLPVEDLLFMRICDVIPRTETTPACIAVLGSVLRDKTGEEIPFQGSKIHKQRILPLPDVLEDALSLAHLLPHRDPYLYFYDFETAIQKNLSVRGEKRPLFPASQFSMHHINRQKAIRQINRMFAHLAQDTRFLDGTGNPLKRSASFSPYPRMLATSEKALRSLSIDEDELRYIRGLTPNTVAAKAYCDFTHENELYRLYCFFNLSLPPFDSGTTLGRTVSVPLRPAQMAFSLPDKMTQLLLTAQFPPSAEGLPLAPPKKVTPLFRISAEYGFNISAQYEEEEIHGSESL